MAPGPTGLRAFGAGSARYAGAYFFPSTFRRGDAGGTPASAPRGSPRPRDVDARHPANPQFGALTKFSWVHVAFRRSLAYDRIMIDRQFKPDLTGSGETLDHLLARLRSHRLPVRPRREGPSDWENVFTSRRPPKGAGGAEAPIPREAPVSDAFASL